jgi:hypothetical protein
MKNVPQCLSRFFNPLTTVIAIAFISGGCFSLWSASLTALFIFMLLIFLLWQREKLFLPLSLPLFVIGAVVIAYGLAVFYAVDKAMAFLGFVKITTVAGFLLLSCQIEQESDRKAAWGAVAILGGFSVAVCLGGVLFSYITGASYFFLDNRLGGFLAYANTHALWLLLGLVIIVFQEKLRRRHYLLFALNLSGICLSISRSIALIALITLALLFVLRPAARRLILTMTISGMALGAAVFLLRGMQGDFPRLLETPGQAGEWLSRLIYYQDGLRQIAARPFGWGYLGYWYSQPAFQSACYDARFIHNSILQYALDIGVIPALMILGLGLMLIFSRQTPLMEKIILTLICGHSFIDMDLEFSVLLFIICLTIRPAAKFTAKPDTSPAALKIIKPATPTIILVLLALLHVYCGLINYAADKGPANLALMLYPRHTEVLEQQMMSATTLEEAVPYALRLAQSHEYAFTALDTLARDLYRRGDIQQAAALKLRSIAINRFFAQDYVELLHICNSGYELATSAGDTDDAEYYRQLIISIPLMMEKASLSLHKDAYRLKQKPDLQLPPPTLEYIENI